MQVELLKIVAEHAVMRYKMRCLAQMYGYYNTEESHGYEQDAY